jgi:ABC-type multidrug transport system fused ATPase/permease subunit
LRNLFRAFAAVYRYKAALAGCVVCVLIVGALYSVSIGTMLPVIKTLISDEGLHGWVRGLRAESRLGANLRREYGRDAGLRIIRLRAGSPLAAEPASAVEGSVITAIEGVPLAGAEPTDAAVIRLLEAPPGQAVVLTVMTASGQATARVVPWDEPAPLRLIAWIADRLPEGGASAQLAALSWILGFFILVVGLGAAMQYLQDYITLRITLRAVMDLRCRAFDSIVRRPLADVQRIGGQELTGRFSVDFEDLRGTFVIMLGQTMREPIKAAAALALAFYVDWVLALVCLLLVPPALGAVRLLSRRLYQRAHHAMSAAAGLLATFQEVVFNLRAVKAYAAENHERRRFLNVSRDNVEKSALAASFHTAAPPLTEFLTSAGAALLALLAASLVVTGRMERESFFAFLVCVVALAEPIRRLTPVLATLRRGDVAARRIFELIDADAENAVDGRRVVGADVGPLRRAIGFEAVGFRYSDNNPWVLRDVSVEFPAGGTVALVGPNGSGKTTLISLIPRLYEPCGGRILWDGVDTRTLDLTRLRRRIGLVTQEALIFKDTAHRNIAYADDDCPREKVVQAARRARADDFIRALRDNAGRTGYDALLAEQGQSLSGGQRQRIALARAILRDPSVLILDEATSQIDSESEALIREALLEFGRGRTVIVIAHRLSTVRHADRIVVLDEGRVRAVGTHERLLAECELYRRLCEHQLVESPTPSGPRTEAS